MEDNEQEWPLEGAPPEPQVEAGDGDAKAETMGKPVASVSMLYFEEGSSNGAFSMEGKLGYMQLFGLAKLIEIQAETLYAQTLIQAEQARQRLLVPAGSIPRDHLRRKGN